MSANADIVHEGIRPYNLDKSKLGGQIKIFQIPQSKDRFQVVGFGENGEVNAEIFKDDKGFHIIPLNLGVFIDIEGLNKEAGSQTEKIYKTQNDLIQAFKEKQLESISCKRKSKK